LTNLYGVIGISRQVEFQQRKRDEEMEVVMSKLVFACELIRLDHPVIGVRKMYKMLKPDVVGRDRFESYMLSYGFRVNYKPKYIKTTTPLRYSKHKNLLKGHVVKGINRVWVSDITYFIVLKKVYYIVFIKDVYSRMILGYEVSENMQAETILKALEMAFNNREVGKYNYTLIHHSDKGSQYLSKVYELALKKREVLQSVSNVVYENPYAEVINRIIKKEYLENWITTNLRSMRKNLKRAVINFNEKRPHGSLQEMTPLEYEKSLLDLPLPSRKEMTFYTEESS
jgi:transposase InsO family protein